MTGASPSGADMRRAVEVATTPPRRPDTLSHRQVREGTLPARAPPAYERSTLMLTPSPDNPFYLRQAEIIATCGPVAAVVYDVVRHLSQPDGSGPTHQVVAQKLGIGVATARRAIDKLIGAGVIKAESRWDGHQTAHRYSFPTTSQGDQNDHLENSPLVAPPLVDGDDEGDGEELETVSSSVVSTSPSPSKCSGVPGDPGRPRPLWKLLDRRNPLYTHRHTRELVEFFTDHILARDIREKGKARKISARRLGKWIETANDGLDHYSLEELTAIVAWVFTHSLGQLPFPVVNRYTGRVDPRERRVTRLAQILEHYPELMAMMSQGSPPEPVQEILATKPKAFYDHGEGFAAEDQVAVLVELFAKTRPRQPSDFNVFGWRKTFRIMLEHHRSRSTTSSRWSPRWVTNGCVWTSTATARPTTWSADAVRWSVHPVSGRTSWAGSRAPWSGSRRGPPQHRPDASCRSTMRTWWVSAMTTTPAQRSTWPPTSPSVDGVMRLAVRDDLARHHDRSRS